MKTIQTLAASLLLLTGAMHVALFATSGVMDAAMIITLVFGIIYLALGLLLFRGGRVVYWFAAILPLVGLLLAGVGMLTNPTLVGAIFMAIDIVIAACCFKLLLQKRHLTIAS